LVWYRHGERHRDDGPAVDSASGKEWYRNDKLHRDDGPAVERADGTKEWFRNDQRLTDEEVAAIKNRTETASTPAGKVVLIPARPTKP
jgi:hypothetical protein